MPFVLGYVDVLKNITQSVRKWSRIWWTFFDRAITGATYKTSSIIWIPASLTYIQEGVFFDCQNLVSIELPKTIYAIGGELQKLGGGIFLCTPNNVNVEGTMSEENASKDTKSSKKKDDDDEDYFN